MKIHETFAGGVVVFVLFSLGTVAVLDVGSESQVNAIEQFHPNPSARSNYSSNDRLNTYGYIAFPGQFPYHAEVRVTKSTNLGYALFAGSLITSYYILTSGSSVYYYVHDAYDVHGYASLGLSNNYDVSWLQTINFSGEDIFLHPMCDTLKQLNDIATIRLEHSASLNNFVSPIRLPPLSDARTYELMEGTATGGDYQNILRYVRNPVMSNADCDREYPGIVNAEHACTDSYIGGIFCNQEYGSGLIIEDERGPMLIGITVSNYGCLANYPSLFTRVSEFRDFISMNSDYVFEV